jgi:hypothetical protein
MYFTADVASLPPISVDQELPPVSSSTSHSWLYTGDLNCLQTGWYTTENVQTHLSGWVLDKSSSCRCIDLLRAAISTVQQESSSGMDWAWLAWHWSIAIAARIMLLLSGAGEALLWRPEVSTPANTLLKTREGIRLLQLGISPYEGESCHIPPLWLAVVAPWAHHKVLCVLPNIACDVVAAGALLLAAAQLFGCPAGPASRKRGGQVKLQQLS